MSDVLKLSAHDFDLEIAPLAGGGIARLDWAGLALLRPALLDAASSRDPLGLSSFPMTPYVSRITDGVFTWGDVTTQIAPNMAGGAHPLHGIGWRKPWKVLTKSREQIEIGLTHGGDDDWPWAFETRQTFMLHDGCFEHRLSVQSRDPRAFPASLGPHPYFHAKDATIKFDAEALWETSGEAIPTHRACPPVVGELRAGARANTLNLDHCFDGWNGQATVQWPKHRVLLEAACALDGQFYPCTRLQLYTPKGENFFCLEPVTARCVAFSEPDPMLHGVTELTDQSLSITTRLTPSMT